MTGYELSKDWFDWAFENPDLNSPNTTALYMWVIEKWNRMSQKPKFGFPASEAMEAIGVKSYNTYKKSLNDLVELGAITMVQESKNQYTANIIAISKFNKAHTKALAKHLTKQHQSTGESSSSIDKLLTKNQELRTNTEPPVGAETDFMGLQAQVEQWLDYKKSRKEKYRTQGSVQAMIKNLFTLSGGNKDTASAIIEQSMANNWAGLFALKTTAAANPQADHRNNPDPKLGIKRYKPLKEFGDNYDYYLEHCQKYGHTPQPRP